MERKKEKIDKAPNWKKPRIAESAGIEIEREWAGDHVGADHPRAIAKATRTNMLKQLIEPRTSELIDVMFELSADENVHPSIRLEAASRLLDRVYGKPKEHMVLEDNTEQSTDGDEVMTMLNRILESVGAPLIEAPGQKPES